MHGLNLVLDNFDVKIAEKIISSPLSSTGFASSSTLSDGYWNPAAYSLAKDVAREARQAHFFTDTRSGLAVILYSGEWAISEIGVC